MNNYKIYTLLICFFFFLSCDNKNEDVFSGAFTKGELGVTEIESITSIKDSTATLNCVLSYKGKGYLLARGIFWSTTALPTIDNGHAEVKDTGIVTLRMSKLTPGTLYYVRPYITNNEGTAYGTELSFTTKSIPTATIASAAANLTAVSATITGTITADGGDSVTVRGVCWGTNTKPTIALATKTTNGAGKGSFSADITGLVTGTSYYARTYATNVFGTAYSSELIFTTQNTPTLTTTAISNISAVTATSGGAITNDGGSAIIARGVCWSTTQNPTIDLATKTNDGIGIGTFTSNMVNLQMNTTYYVRAYATNALGTSYGVQQTFTTNGYATITTNAVSAITTSTATCGGNTTSTGGTQVTARGVCWSTSSNPTIADSKTSDGTGTGTFTSAMSGLTAGTTYYVRAYATNNTGTNYGAVISFTTNAITLPTLTTTTISSITTTSASSGGTITNDGGAAITARGVCWSTSSNPTISNNKTSDGTGTDSYISSLTGLQKGTTYYVRAYATNSLGTSYGTQLSFSTYSNLAIGMSYLGGKIVYIDASGIHGFVCALSDQSEGIAWWNGTNISTGANNWEMTIENVGVYGIKKSGGRKNTDAIIVAQGIGNYAAYICAQMTEGGAVKGEWYLPSNAEFAVLADNKSLLGILSGTYYWTSSESQLTNSAAIIYDFNSYPASGYGSYKNNINRVRAIRAF